MYVSVSASCQKATEIKKDVRQDCLGFYDLLSEQESAYDQNWTIFDRNYYKGIVIKVVLKTLWT